MSVAVASAIALSLALSACAGSAGGETTQGAEGAGFEYGASQSEVDAALADLNPATLTYQSSHASQNSPSGQIDVAIKEAIEKRSGGKITVDIAWANAIAGFSEIDDALADGRIDIGLTLPPYEPQAYPAHNSVVEVTSGFPNSPIVGNAVTAAVMTDISYTSQEVRDEFTDKGLVPLLAFRGSSPYYTFCSEPVTALESWKGKQIRAGGQAFHTTFDSLGAVPMSMEYGEAYEALQRGVLDCEMGRSTSTVDMGISEVAPHMGYTDDESNYLGMVQGSLVAGAGYQSLPIGYQQVVFDALSTYLAGTMNAHAESTYDLVHQLDSAGGSITMYDDDVLEIIRESNVYFREKAAGDGYLSDGFAADMDADIVEWGEIVEELGYEDGGGLEDFDTWYSPGSVDFVDIADRIFADVMLPHRPQD